MPAQDFFAVITHGPNASSKAGVRRDLPALAGHFSDNGSQGVSRNPHKHASYATSPYVNILTFGPRTARSRRRCKRIAVIRGVRNPRTQLELGRKSPAAIMDNFGAKSRASIFAQTARFLTAGFPPCLPSSSLPATA